LTEYLDTIQAKLPGLMIGCYLHGSLALGAFNEHFSDIDFITVMSRRCTESDIQRLADVHRMIAAKYPRWQLQGSYLQPDDLGKTEAAIEPAPYYSDGVLHPAGHHDLNEVTWWLLKNRGITLFGAENLNYTVDWSVLIEKMRENLNTYWVRFIQSPTRIAWLFSDDGIQWAVLGVLRQFYTFNEGDITSKVGAGEYGLVQLPHRWHRLIQEALNIRNRTGERLYPSRLLRAVDAFLFLRYLIRLCNKNFV
jgi:hypothetical protein